jgi:multidrug resistance efflux pump
LGRFVIVGAALAIAAGAILWFQPWASTSGSMLLPGTVEIQEVRLGPRVGGRVARVHTVEGRVVEAGAPLVELEIPELRAQLARAEAQRASAEAALERAVNGPRAEEKAQGRADLDAAQARLDRLLAGARKEEIDQARSELASAEAESRVMQEEWDRVESLTRRGFSSTSEADTARGNRDRLTARARAARARLDLLLAGTRAEEIAEARALLEAAKAKLELLDAGTRKEDLDAARADVEAARAAVAELQSQVAEAVVVAPEKAVVEVVAVRPGDLVPANQPVVRVLRADDLWVKVYAPETVLGRLRLGQEVEVRSDSYPGRSFQGRVAQIASISEFTPRNVQSPDERRFQVFALKVRVDDPQGVFKSGMAADVILPLHDAPSASTP